MKRKITARPRKKPTVGDWERRALYAEGEVIRLRGLMDAVDRQVRIQYRGEVEAAQRQAGQWKTELQVLRDDIGQLLKALNADTLMHLVARLGGKTVY